MSGLLMGLLIGAACGLIALQLCMLYYQRVLMRVDRDMKVAQSEAVMWEFLFERSNSRLIQHVDISQEMIKVLRDIAFDADCDSVVCGQARKVLANFEDLVGRQSYIIENISKNT